jgi:hypothetical protein
MHSRLDGWEAIPLGRWRRQIGHDSGMVAGEQFIRVSQKSAMAHGFLDAKQGNTERGWRRSLPGIPLRRSISGGLERWTATSLADLGHRGGPLVVGLLWEWSKWSHRVTTELGVVLAGLEDQHHDAAMATILTLGDGGEIWTRGHQGLLFIGGRVLEGSWQCPGSSLQPNQRSLHGLTQIHN